MDKIEKIMDELDLKYEKEHDNEDNSNIYYSGILTEEDRELEVVIIENYDLKTVTIYVPEIVLVPDEFREKVILKLNEINCTVLYGTYFLREGQNNVSYKHSHSIEGSDINITKEQIEDYFGLISIISDKVVEYVGKITNEYC